ncbi:AAEL017529-PA [Aedes aegypti]|uniref:AAEL017529-PA n=1 Tax=Aedes aegypti TaxID=7159 RepID=J9HY24_AEDAE|nr:AAEL017529-PA [Aedes aegypti]
MPFDISSRRNISRNGFFFFSVLLDLSKSSVVICCVRSEGEPSNPPKRTPHIFSVEVAMRYNSLKA